MKIKCTDHERRVHVFEKTVVHRSDGSKCKTKLIRAGEVVVTPARVRNDGRVERATIIAELTLDAAKEGVKLKRKPRTDKSRERRGAKKS
jgi:hypothetical protein